MKFKLILFAAIIFLGACASEESSAPEQQVVAEEMKKEAMEESAGLNEDEEEEFNFVMPSAMQITSIFSRSDTQFNSDGVQFIINPYDEWYALVRALEIKESQGGTVTIIHAGPAENDSIIRKALAIGADDAVRINMESNDALAVAKEIAPHLVADDRHLPVIQLVMLIEETPFGHRQIDQLVVKGGDTVDHGIGGAQPESAARALRRGVVGRARRVDRGDGRASTDPVTRASPGQNGMCPLRRTQKFWPCMTGMWWAKRA